MVVPGLGEREGSERFMGTECPLGTMASSGDGGGDGATAPWVSWLPVSCTLASGKKDRFYVCFYHI